MTLDDLMNNGDPREIKRAISVKMFLSGFSRESISSILNVGVDFVTKWNKIYREQDVNGLLLGHIGSEGYLTDEERRSIHKYIKTHETMTIEELSSYIKTNYGVSYSSPSSYHKLLHEANMSWKKTEKVNPKRDEEAVIKKHEEIKKNRR